MPTRIWLDNHVHVSDLDAEGHPRERFLQELLAVLDRDEADLRFVISPDGARMSRLCREEGGVTEGNEFIRDLVARAPGRLYGSCMVNPNFLDESLRIMERAFGEWGFVQLGELLPYAMEHRMADPEAECLVREAVQYDVPVQVHISTSNRVNHASSFGMDQLEDLARLVERVPEARYVLAHLVGMPDDNPPVVDQYLDFIDRVYGGLPPNFWVEIRDFDSPGVRSVLERVPVTRIIAGTDWVTRVGPPFLPYGTIFGVQKAEDNPYPPCVASMVRFLQQAGADEETIEWIGLRNLAELLGIAV